MLTFIIKSIVMWVYMILVKLENFKYLKPLKYITTFCAAYVALMRLL